MRNNEIVWHCKRISGKGEEIEIFDKPIAYRLRENYLTIQPAGGFMDNQAYGEFVELTNKGFAQPYKNWINKISDGDRFYLDGKVPDGLASGIEPSFGWGYDADSKIISVKPYNQAIQFALRKIVE